MIDAHFHLQEEVLAGRREEAWATARAAGVERGVVNGTHPGDWDEVASLCARLPGLLPSYGVHPWEVGPRLDPGWAEAFDARLDADPSAGIGEIGLDRWVEGHDLAAQLPVFARQWDRGVREDRPVTVHVLRAWGAFTDFLRGNPAPRRGFLLHAYGGPAELVPELAARGARFSFSASFLTPGRERKLEPFRRIPRDRLLLETDAPAMPPPPELDLHGWTAPAGGSRLQHPANLIVARDGLARLLGLSPEALASLTTENFRRWWGG